jgi:hypothetical protein
LDAFLAKSVTSLICFHQVSDDEKPSIKVKLIVFGTVSGE